MHMSNELVSPMVATSMMAVSTGAIGYCTMKLREEDVKSKLSTMGIMGAFVFAAQMLNFTIPGTGSSGHLCGGILLAAMLGPYAGFLTMAAILAVQAVIFGDGGLLALGANIFNMGFLSCFVAYPLVFKPIVKLLGKGKDNSLMPIIGASLIASIVGLQLGALGVIVETHLSGITELATISFVGKMLPIHLAIGAVEGVIVALTLSFAFKVTPQMSANYIDSRDRKTKHTSIVWAIIIFIIAGGLSQLASSLPDGLEWSIGESLNIVSEETGMTLHVAAEQLQAKLAIMPDYSFEASSELVSQFSTSIAGVVGAGVTFLLVIMIGKMSRKESIL